MPDREVAERSFCHGERFAQIRLRFVCDVIDCMRIAENLQRDGITQIFEKLRRLGHEIPIFYLVPELLQRNDMPKCFPRRVEKMTDDIGVMVRLFESFRGAPLILPIHRQFLSDVLFLLHALVSRITIGADDERWGLEVYELLPATHTRFNHMQANHVYDPEASRISYKLATDIFYKSYNCPCCLCVPPSRPRGVFTCGTERESVPQI